MAKSNLPVSDLTQRLAQPGSDVWAVHYDAVARQEAGDDIILLSVGDPDFDTPPYISEYVIKQINKGRTHYSPAAGEPELRRTIAELESKNTGKSISIDQVVTFPGATATFFATMSCILNPGDGIIIPEPMYVGYHGATEALGAERQTVPLSLPSFELNIDAVRDRVEPNSKCVLINTPGNPCGNLIPARTLAALADMCREKNLWLICDEVYSLITFDEPHVSMLNCTEDLSNVIVIDGLSKSHAMSGWRVGWAITSEEMAGHLTRMSGATFFGASQFIQDAAAYALANDARDVEEMRVEYQRRRDFVVSRLQQIPKLNLHTPQGGMFVMIDVSAVAEDGEAFSRGLLDTEGVAVLPGRCFGPSGSVYVRLSLTEPVEILGNALDRVANYCQTS
ncbi:MAG: pyridoxal phosphate-dependent aminotransferase [Pseudomonadota bacterium]